MLHGVVVGGNLKSITEICKYNLNLACQHVSKAQGITEAVMALSLLHY